MNKRQVGSEWEHIASSYLSENGYEIVELNFHSRQGEIDIVARDGEYTCFIEVKYRKAPSHGYPAEAVDRRKISRICKAASYYMLTKGVSFESPVRFDVVCIEGGNISLIRNAFDYAP